MPENLLNEFLSNIQKFADGVANEVQTPELPASFQEELKRPRRKTTTISLADSQVVKDFETEWQDALIKNDALRQGLAFANNIFNTIMSGGFFK